mmetsp:Transcript_58327/g.103645  ORF Transcript_58327/g.103645 Transcript_58327/m.103645 type:complete len:518 (-) Transcript_58327:96-1649(-)
MVSSSKSPQLNGAWMTFVSIMFLMLAAGTIYGFGLWSTLLKMPHGYGMDQVHVSSLSLAASLGEYFAIDIGVFVTTFGTIAGFSLGCFLCSLGYFCLWLSTGHYNGLVPFPLLVVFCFLYGHGCGFIVNSSMTEVLRNFDNLAGYATGSMKAHFGLATATMTVIYYAAFEGMPSNYLLFLSMYTMVVGAIFIPVIYATRGRCEEKRSTGTLKFQILCAGIAFFALACFALQLLSDSLSSTAWKLVLLALFCLSSLPFLLARAGWETPEDSRILRATSEDEAGTAHPDDVSGFGILCRMDFYLLFAALTISQGASLLVISNSAQILPAFAGGPIDTTGFVGMLSVSGCYGRLFFGGVSDALAATVNRPWWVVVACVIIGISHLVLCTGDLRLVYVGAAAVSFGYGGIFGVLAAFVKELFGMKDIAVKLGIVACAAGAGSLLFSTLLAGKLYDREATRLGTSPNCYQPSCFQPAFLTCAICSLVAVFFAATVAYRTKWIYSSKDTSRKQSDEKTYTFGF